MAASSNCLKTEFIFQEMTYIKCKARPKDVKVTEVEHPTWVKAASSRESSCVTIYRPQFLFHCQRLIDHFLRTEMISCQWPNLPTEFNLGKYV